MISVRHLSKAINGQEILMDVDLDVRDGEILFILGESGAGKSVLLQHLIGLFKPDEGSVMIDGVDIVPLSDREMLKIRKTIGYLFQEGALYDFMTVEENVAFPLQEHSSLSPSEIRKKVGKILALVGLEGVEQKYPAELSGGMRKRAALARAVILDSKFLFCDEPTSGLDPIRSQDITDLIKDISRQLRCTTVATSHDVKNSFRIADRLAIIQNGRLIAQGTKDELLRSSDPFLKKFLN